MGVRVGKNAKIAVGDTKVARMTSFSLTVNNNDEDITEFGNDWEHHYKTINNWTATAEGYLDLDDTEQDSMESKALSGGTYTDIRFYVDASNYYVPDTDTDDEAMCSLESWNPTADATGIVSFSATFKGSGPVKRTTV